jgi:hypothetical protein
MYLFPYSKEREKRILRLLTYMHRKENAKNFDLCKLIIEGIRWKMDKGLHNYDYVFFAYIEDPNIEWIINNGRRKE